ncbi:MAG: tRNA (adenosine(37)-N6)-dimethylallyltransferase MiaA [Bacteroidetes bacterium]|nr:tRNA (adenosine(37)-N6)-dimethylallyltransferase MiaA [Bacteroidota bacterium]
MTKTCFIIAGPTASGKTAFAIQLAQLLHTSIISCDSRQCFTELNIGVAKPSAEELQSVHHYFINSHSIHEEVNAAVFEQYALKAIDDIFQHSDAAVMVGGTGLYIKAFRDGIDMVPNVDAAIRTNIIAGYEQHGLAWLQQQVQQHDPLYFESGEIQNPQRLMRALEVKLSSGQSITHYQTGIKKQRDFNIITVGLELPREMLYQQINRRVDVMMEQGLLNEVQQLLPYEKWNALQTVGYRELFSHLHGEISLQVAVEQIKQNTRHYAKRQMTWFKKDAAINWVSPHLPVSSLLADYGSGKLV